MTDVRIYFTNGGGCRILLNERDFFCLENGMGFYLGKEKQYIPNQLIKGYRVMRENVTA